MRIKQAETIKRLTRLGDRIPKERKHRFSLTLLFSAVIFAILFIAIALAMLAVWIFTEAGVLSRAMEEMNIWLIAGLVGGISLLIGATVSLLFGKFPLKPINTLINHMNRLAAGDFQARLRFGGMISDHPIFNEISDSFNTLAEELENTEMLRGDFVNNFSHEFKSPIVSIAGLAKLVNKGNLTEEQRAQYLTAIEEESLRLASMATNVLNLTKVENQTILTDVGEYNLSEQLRSCVLLLENKWTKKNIELQLLFEEHSIAANEELLKQVWLNLLDNAIKFSPEGGEVAITIRESDDRLAVTVTNEGDAISPENQRKIFNKFYQADESHAAEGNGIGLAIVRRIVELHGGVIELVCENHTISFCVELSAGLSQKINGYKEKE